MHVIWSLFFLLIICFIGFMTYRKTIKKIKFYKDFCFFCQTLQTHIVFFQNKIKDIILAQDFNGDFNEVLKGVLENNYQSLDNISYLKEDEKQEILLFFKKLGRANVETEKMEIQNFQKKKEEDLTTLKSIGLKNGKLKFSLTIMLGFFVFIIML